AGYPLWQNDPEGDVRWFFTANEHFSHLLGFLRQYLQGEDDERHQAAQEAGRESQHDAKKNEDDDRRWLTVTEAAQITACDKGVISRAGDEGKLKSNGKTGRKRRIDGIDLNRWQLERAAKPEPVESDEAVTRKLRRNDRD